MAGSNIDFISGLTDEELAYLYGHAQALVMPQEEDLGYVSLEAISCGCAVIAYNKGGATEIVKHGKTGYLFEEQSADGILDAIENFQPLSYTVERYLQMHSADEVKPFSQDIFTSKFSQII
jgi:glycosyltransferase involved in cell wall biosynthesis